MTTTLTVDAAGPLLTLQDAGRPGHTGVGLSQGGAMDRRALLEGAALLGLPGAGHAIEMAGTGGRLTSDAPLRLALTGAPMAARIDGAPLRWHAVHLLLPGQVLEIGGVQAGSYGYLCLPGSVQGRDWRGSIATHLSAGLGQPLAAGDRLMLDDDPHPDRPATCLVPQDRWAGGTLRLMPGPQTDLFDAATRDRLAATPFRRDPRSNRTGLRLMADGAGFAPLTANPVSDFITCGDVQVTGDGAPFILMAECQTIGGYPRIGTVIAADLPRAAQTPAQATIRLHWLTLAEADGLYQTEADLLRDLRRQVQPLIRDPADMPDLLSYQLIDGVTAGTDPEQPA